MRTACFSGHLFGGVGGVCSGGLLGGGLLGGSATHPGGQTDACEKITLSLTSFADGNKQQKR